MKINVTFPIDKLNRKEVREQLLLDSRGNGVEDSLFAAANAAKTPEQKVFVSRSYGRAGRLSVWIVDDTGVGSVRDRTNALKEALARVRL